MTIWEYAIARAAVQLSNLSDQRPLTPSEQRALENLSACTERYARKEGPEPR